MKPHHERFPNVLEAVLLILTLFCAEILADAALHDMRPILSLGQHDLPAAITLIGNGLLFSGLLCFKRMGFGELFHPGNAPVKVGLASLLLPIMLLIPALEVSVYALDGMLETCFPMSPGEQESMRQLISTDFPSMVLTCLMAPVLEEMLFRGIILRGFLERYARVPAIFGAALLFALAHHNIYQFPVAMIVGAIVGWLYERTRSLWPGIAMHAAYNSLSFLWGVFPALLAAMLNSIGLWLAVFIAAALGSFLLQRLLEPGQAGGDIPGK
jgi:membrane protease YdiL (CAAX protease family)